MKRFIVILLACFWFLPYTYSSEKEGCESCVDLKIDNNRKFIRYELGINTIYIADGDTVCDIFVDREHRNMLSATCRKTPILKWAFEDMGHEVGTPQFEPKNEYNPLWDKLSLIDDGNCRIIDTSTATRTEYDENVEGKISELKTFIVKVWATIMGITESKE